MLSVASLFPYPHPYPAGVLEELVNYPNIVYPVNAGTLNATRPHISTYISG
jgi:hypothetical protein